MRLVEIHDGLWVNPDRVQAVEALDRKVCVQLTHGLDYHITVRADKTITEVAADIAKRLQNS